MQNVLEKIRDFFRKDAEDAQVWVMGGTEESGDSWDKRRIGIAVGSLVAVIALIVGLMFTFSGGSTEVADDMHGSNGPVNVDVPDEDDDSSVAPSESAEPSESGSPSTSPSETNEQRGGGVGNQGGRSSSTSEPDSPSTSTPPTSSNSGRGGGVDNQGEKIGRNGGTFETPGRGYEPKEGEANKKGAKVIYTVIVSNSTGSGDIEVTYIDSSGSPKSDRGSNSWNKSFSTATERPALGVSASSKQGPVTCTISVDGIIASTQTSKKAGDKVTCGNA